MSFPNTLTNPAQANGPVIVNENLTALAASGMYARNYATSTGLVLGYFGGHIAGSAIADGTTTLAASEANVYVVAHRTTGAVTSATNTTNWNDTSTYGRLYHAVTGAATITTLTDWRGQVGGWFDKAAGGSGGTVTSVAASVPAFLSVSGSPVTTTGTLAISYSGTALPVANGGTGITAFGTGVATALGVNVGSAGAFVVQGGALGTPSSGTLTNATGLPAAAVTYTPAVLADWDGSADPGDLDDALDQLAERVADVEAGSAGPSVASRYVIDLASQSDGDPGSGKLRFNHATPTSATKIFLDDETSDGVDLSTTLLDLGSSGYIRIQSVDDVGEWLYAKWTAITDDTGYFDIAITVLASKGTLDDTDDVLVTFDAKGASTGGGGDPIFSLTALQSHPTTSNPMTPAASTIGIPLLEADFAATNESTRFLVQLPYGISLASGVDVTVRYTCSVNTGQVRFGARFMRLSTSLNSDSFDTAVEAHGTVPGTAGDPGSITLAAVGVDGASAGDWMILEVYRDASDTTNDTAAGYSYIFGVEGRV
jgi:hypothetical protein